MKRELAKLSIAELHSKFHTINFPEYQREPTVWNLEKKQLLIDSILRGFDIASIYFYVSGEAEIHCIDGRQRINAIMSFLGENDQYQAEHNAFKYKTTNEIFDDEGEFSEIDGLRYEDEGFASWQHRIHDYTLNIVEVSDVSQPEELNLLFLRLQLGSILNAGEKLHAMTGDIREFIFDTFSKHEFFKSITIPYRRYARQQVAAQIACHLFAKRGEGSYARTRYIDLQAFFKRYKEMDKQDHGLAGELFGIADQLIESLGGNVKLLRNRAMTVSLFLFAEHLISGGDQDQLFEFSNFYAELLARLAWQIPKGIDIHPAYRDLVRLQIDITQAAVERSAVTRRHEFILRYFDHYRKHGDIIGDAGYAKDTGAKPGEDL